jgi:DNA recombination protein RmuC
MSVLWIVLFAVLVLGFGGLIGWLYGGRSGAGSRVERDLHLDNFKKAIGDLEGVVRERDTALRTIVGLEVKDAERDTSFAAQMASMREAKEALTAQFSEIGGKLLGDAQRQFLERAEARFKQSENITGEGLKALLQPVSERLLRYEEAVGKVEAERRDSYGELKGLMDSMRIGQEAVKAEAAKLGNSLRHGPKTRGRWGEQQLRNVLGPRSMLKEITGACVPMSSSQSPAAVRWLWMQKSP